jgi:hypothetical protein
MVLSKLHLKENQHVSKVLVRLLVQDSFDLRVGVVLHLVKVLFKNKLSPDLDNLAEESLCLDEASLFFEQLTHVVIATTHVIALGAILIALQINAFGQFVKCLCMSASTILCQEKSSESLV